MSIDKSVCYFGENVHDRMKINGVIENEIMVINGSSNYRNKFRQHK